MMDLARVSIYLYHEHRMVSGCLYQLPRSLRFHFFCMEYSYGVRMVDRPELPGLVLLRLNFTFYIENM